MEIGTTISGPKLKGGGRGAGAEPRLWKSPPYSILKFLTYA